MATQEERFELTGGNLALDFANTVGGPAERLDLVHGYADLVAWADQGGTLGAGEGRSLLREAERRPREAEAVARRALRLSQVIYRIFRRGGRVPPARFAAAVAGQRSLSEELDALNDEVGRSLAHARLSPAGSWTWHQSDDLERVLWPVVRAAADLWTSDERALVKECASDTCQWLFLDRSRNRSRRWCAMSDCGNRAKARRFLERRRRARARKN